MQGQRKRAADVWIGTPPGIGCAARQTDRRGSQQRGILHKAEEIAAGIVQVDVIREKLTDRGQPRHAPGGDGVMQR
ncbi:hypothetical protein RZS08_49485, partial [Arthrospira platensis SPKY1]|nr:hypothetical protein [Arthrospira platensis SPKY1]